MQQWNIASSGEIGDTFGGTVGPFIGWLAAILTFAAFIVQYQANKQHKEQFIKQAETGEMEKFESRFFDLLKIHRENVNEMRFHVSFDMYENHQIFDKKIDLVGKDLIKYIVKQVVVCMDEIAPFFQKIDAHDIYNPDYLSLINQERKLTNRKATPIEIAKNDIAYCVVFFGLEPDGWHVCKRTFSAKYKIDFIESVLNYLSLKPLENSKYWVKWRKLKRSKNHPRKLLISKDILLKRRNMTAVSERTQYDINDFYYSSDYLRYYSGFQQQLGHYFRHLYQTVNYVNDQSIIGFKEKYNQIKSLRAQLSTFEQVLLYYNSISSLGNTWELRVSRKFDKEKQIDEKILVNNYLITKYNLIKNIPTGQLYRQDLTRFYPDVEFESSNYEKNDKLKALYS